jgi:NSS family neurotransmitter:Na+ symporter
MKRTEGSRETWGSSLGFILAAAGSAVGLGNIWKFPYITGLNGGGAFVLVYLLCITIIGLPVMLCELTLGRHTRRNPVGAFKALSPPSSTLAQLIGAILVFAGFILLCFSTWGWAVTMLLIGAAIFRYSWIVVGAMGVVAGFTILSFYSVVAGWTIGYIGKAFAGQLGFTTVDAAASHFVGFITHPGWAIGCHLVFMLLCMVIVIRGVQKGIERWSKILMPVLFILLVMLIIRALTLPGAMAGVRFFLSPDFSKINTESILQALGHAFFTLSLGMGAMITYGSYVGKQQNIFLAALSIAGLDTLIALMAGLAIFPAVFAQGFSPGAGPGLVFQVLPTVFNQIPLGALWATIFFLLLLVAALTSGISLLEVVTAYFVDEWGWSRSRATIVLGAVTFFIGCFSAVSVTGWERIEWLHRIILAVFGTAKGSFFDVMDNLSSNWLLPLGGLFISLFVGWVWGPAKAVAEIRHGSHNFADVHLISLLAGLKDDPSHNSDVHVLTLASIWGFFIRFLSPVAVMITFLYTIGWLKL